MNTLWIKLRKQGRKLGLHHLVSKVSARLRPGNHYEERFGTALRNAIHPADVVWDVGANVGLYAEQFCRWVGPAGHVVAFEPNPQPFAELQRRVSDCAWITLMNVALGSRAGSCPFVADKEYSPKSHLQFEGQVDAADEDVVVVEVSTGDAVCAQLGQVPNVVKIDVEGFEDDVLAGLDQTLSSPSLRVVLLEIHLQALEDRGRPNAPIQIGKLLRSRGFKIKWIDRNHLRAERKQ